VSWSLTAHGVVQALPDELVVLRKKPWPGDDAFLPANFLKHSDDQTVAGVAAVFRAIHAFQLDRASFANWGVLAAPRFLGRLAMAGALKKIFAEGAWSVSPHLIPNQALHALAGTLSIALHIHGPNFGVGGGWDSPSEIFMAAAALLTDRELPGLWLVLTAWDPEPVPDKDGRNSLPSVCRAVALALTPPESDWNGHRLHLMAGQSRKGNGVLSRPQVLTLEALAETLTDPKPAQVIWPLEAGGTLEFEPGRGVNQR
jgi:hypothetical protein